MSDQCPRKYNFYAELMEAQREVKRGEITTGFQSPHHAFRFAEDLAQGQAVKEKLDVVHSVGSIEPCDLICTASNVVASPMGHPVGEGFTEFFHERYGREPYTESYTPASASPTHSRVPVHVPATDGGHQFTESHLPDNPLSTPTTMHTQTKEEQYRPNQQIAEQDTVALSQARLSFGLREGSETEQQEPEVSVEAPMSNQSRTQKQDEVQNQFSGSMVAHEAKQADFAMAVGGSGNDGGCGPPDDNGIDLKNASAPTIGQNLRVEFLAGQQQNETPAIDSLDETREPAPENDTPAIDRLEETKEPTPENDAPAIDRLEEAPPAPEQDQQAHIRQQEQER